jgi:Arc/MetJ-type ribon-helix-helix transcriptional regulator
MTLTEIRKHVSTMRQDAIRWKKEFPADESLQGWVKQFFDAYKVTKAILDAPKEEFFFGNRETRVKVPYGELLNYHESIFQRVLSLRNELRVIELEKAPEIKSAEGQVKMSFRGGARPGSGRKRMGRKEKVSLVLPDEEWEFIDELIRNGHAASRADYFRQLHFAQRSLDDGTDTLWEMRTSKRSDVADAPGSRLDD